MKKKVIILILAMMLSSCIVVPSTDQAYVNKCEISSDRKTLKVIDVAKDTNSYYSISGIILLPLSGVVSGIYVAVNNVYHLSEEKLVCAN